MRRKVYLIQRAGVRYKFCKETTIPGKCLGRAIFTLEEESILEERVNSTPGQEVFDFISAQVWLTSLKRSYLQEVEEGKAVLD